MVEIVRYTSPLQDDVIALILEIQRDEFGFNVCVADQPDLLAVDSFYHFGSGNFWVALDGSTVVGTVALRDIGNHQVALKRMYVKASHRGGKHSIASHLLAEAMAAAAGFGVSDVFLGTTDKFLAAHWFYEKNGFVRVLPEALPVAFPRVPVDTRFYHLRLPNDA